MKTIELIELLQELDKKGYKKVYVFDGPGLSHGEPGIKINEETKEVKLYSIWTDASNAHSVER